MGFIKKENKKFNYKPFYYKGKGNPYEVKHMFDQYRTTVGKNQSLKSKFSTALDEFKASENGGFNRTIVFLIALFILLFLFFIEFDLSIFLPKNN